MKVISLILACLLMVCCTPKTDEQLREENKALRKKVVAQAPTPKNLQRVKNLALTGVYQNGWMTRSWNIRIPEYPGFNGFVTCRYGKGEEESIISIIEGVEGMGGTEIMFSEKYGIFLVIDYDKNGNKTNIREVTKTEANEQVGFFLSFIRDQIR